MGPWWSVTEVGPLAVELPKSSKRRMVKFPPWPPEAVAWKDVAEET